MLFAFLMGALALLMWLYVTGADRLAVHFIGVGFLYILAASVLNGIVLLVTTHWPSSDGSLSMFLGGVILIPLIEELLKSRAARSQQVAIHSFALVSLFGIYELMISKPFLMYQTVGPVALYETLYALPALTMHTLTAVLYSFYFVNQRNVQFATCLLIHCGFNGFLHFGYFVFLPVTGLLFALAVILMFPWRNKQRRGQWKTSQ